MQNNSDNSGDLNGIPGIGPARRAAFEAAGVLTRAALARMDVAQVVSVSGMGRAQAEAALRFVLDASGDESVDVEAAAPVVSGDEAFPPRATMKAGDAAPALPVPPDEDEDALTAEAQASEVERAMFAVRTALSDVTRVADDARLNRQLTRFDVLLNAMPVRTERLRPKAAREVAQKLTRLAARLERNAVRLATETKREREKRTARLRDRLKAERGALIALLEPSKKRARRVIAAIARTSKKK